MSLISFWGRSMISSQMIYQGNGGLWRRGGEAEAIVFGRLVETILGLKEAAECVR